MKSINWMNTDLLVEGNYSWINLLNDNNKKFLTTFVNMLKERGVLIIISDYETIRNNSQGICSSITPLISNLTDDKLNYLINIERNWIKDVKYYIHPSLPNGDFDFYKVK